MIATRVAGDGELGAWAELKSRVVPNEPITEEQLRSAAEPDRLLLLAELDGVLAGCGIADRSSFGGRAFIAARVLPEHRRHGVGSALVRDLSAHARGLGLTGVNAFVYADEPHSVAFAESFGLAEADFQLEQVRLIGEEVAPTAPAGVELLPLGARRDELLRAAWPVALEGYADLPLPGEVSYELATWLRDEAKRPDGSVVAFEDSAVVGFAGLGEHADGPATAEHGLTVVRRDRRRRGIGRALKQSQLAWAAENGVTRLVTWTQKGNEAMQALNRSLGYRDQNKVLTYQGPLPA
jgi:GNAT superfamily N-acetyltransferase